MSRQTAYQVDVQLTGYTPLLVHKMTIGALEQKLHSSADDYSAEWMSTCYTGADGNSLVCPSTNLESMLVRASTGKKIGKTRLNSLIVQVNIVDFEVPILIDDKGVTIERIKKNNWIDVRSVRIGPSRVARARACIPAGWTLNFKVESGTSAINSKYLHSLFEEAGELVGLMDYRPEKKGKFGQFEVTRFDVA